MNAPHYPNVEKSGGVAEPPNKKLKPQEVSSTSEGKLYTDTEQAFTLAKSLSSSFNAQHGIGNPPVADRTANETLQS